MEEQREIAIECIEEFEELLDEKEISIPDEDREGKEEEARIYGTTYYHLEDKVTEVIKKNYPKIISESLIRGIIKTYNDVLDKKFNYGISQDDKNLSEDLAVEELCDQ